MAEQEFDVTVKLKIKCFGSKSNRKKITQDTVRAILRGMHFVVQDERLTVFTGGGTEIKYDELADDGHHPGHDKVLQVKTKDGSWREW